MPKATAATTTHPPDAASASQGGAVMSAAISTTIPAVPTPRVSPLALAMSLPELWRAHNQTDSAMLELKAKHPDYKRGDCQMRALEDRIDAIEEAALESPAQTLADALAQLIILLPRMREQYDFPCAARTIAGALDVLLPSCAADFSELLRHYTPHSEE